MLPPAITNYTSFNYLVCVDTLGYSIYVSILYALVASMYVPCRIAMLFGRGIISLLDDMNDDNNNESLK